MTVMFGMVRSTPISSMAWWLAPSFAGVRPPWEQAIFEVDVETLSAEMISQLLSEQKKQLKALETEASDLEKVREQREVCKAEISRFDEKLKKLDLVHTEL